MGQFVVALLIGGFFSTLILSLQYCFDVFEQTHNLEEVDNRDYEYAVNIPYSANPFRTRDKPWLFTDMVIISIINYFRSELRQYKGALDLDESTEIALVLYDKTHIIEEFINESKRGKLNEELFNKITDAQFLKYNEEKLFILQSVFKEAHNTLINDLLKVRI